MTPATNITLNFYIEVIPEGSQPRFDDKIMHSAGMSGVITPTDQVQLETARQKSLSLNLIR